MRLAEARNPIQHNRLLGVDLTRPVKCHWNFHKKCYSVAQYDPARKGYRVFAHMDSITLRGVKFTVSESGRQRVLRERVKNVHAHVHGFVEFEAAVPMGDEVYPLRYNPYHYSQFQRVSESGLVPIETASRVTLARSSSGHPQMEATLASQEASHA